MGPRKQHTAEFKAQVALAAIQGYQTLNEVASQYGVHPVQVAQWKRQALAALPEVFASRRARAIGADGHALRAAVYAVDAPAWLRELPAVEMLRRGWVQQFYREAARLHWRTDTQRLPPTSRFISSPYDPA